MLVDHLRMVHNRPSSMRWRKTSNESKVKTSKNRWDLMKQKHEIYCASCLPTGINSIHGTNLFYCIACRRLHRRRKSLWSTTNSNVVHATKNRREKKRKTVKFATSEMVNVATRRTKNDIYCLCTKPKWRIIFYNLTSNKNAMFEICCIFFVFCPLHSNASWHFVSVSRPSRKCHKRSTQRLNRLSRILSTCHGWHRNMLRAYEKRNETQNANSTSTHSSRWLMNRSRQKAYFVSTRRNEKEKN